MSFKEQFPALEPATPARPSGGHRDCERLFRELGFEGYLQRRVHRQLHGIAARFTPEELLELGERLPNSSRILHNIM